MPKRSRYSTGEPTVGQTVIDFNTPPVDPVASIDTPVPETPPGYSIQTGWKDTSGKTRTWVLVEPSGEKIGEITTRGGASRIAELLNRDLEKERSR